MRMRPFAPARPTLRGLYRTPYRERTTARAHSRARSRPTRARRRRRSRNCRSCRRPARFRAHSHPSPCPRTSRDPSAHTLKSESASWVPGRGVHRAARASQETRARATFPAKRAHWWVGEQNSSRSRRARQVVWRDVTSAAANDKRADARSSLARTFIVVGVGGIQPRKLRSNAKIALQSSFVRRHMRMGHDLQGAGLRWGEEGGENARGQFAECRCSILGCGFS